MISFRVVDWSIMSCIPLQSTIVIIWINILDDPLHWWRNSMGQLMRMKWSIESSLSRPLHNLLSSWWGWLLDWIRLVLSYRRLSHLSDRGIWWVLWWWLPPATWPCTSAICRAWPCPLPFVGPILAPLLLVELKDLELVLLEAAAPMATKTTHHSAAD